MSRHNIQAAALSREAVSTNSHLSRADVARSFGLAAQSYDQHAMLQRTVADKLMSGLPELSNINTVLDLGCGTGYCAEKLQARMPASTLVALDLAYPMLSSIQSHDNALALLCADAEALPLQDSSIDLLISSLAIQWCSDLPSLYAELWRVLKPGCSAWLSTFGPSSLQEVKAAWKQVDAYTHVNRFATQDELSLAATELGFACSISGDLMQNKYESLYALSRELKGIGAHNMNRDRSHGLTSPRKFKQAAEFFSAGKTETNVTWEIFYLHLKKPSNV